MSLKCQFLVKLSYLELLGVLEDGFCTRKGLLRFKKKKLHISTLVFKHLSFFFKFSFLAQV